MFRSLAGVKFTCACRPSGQESPQNHASFCPQAQFGLGISPLRWNNMCRLHQSLWRPARLEQVLQRAVSASALNLTPEQPPQSPQSPYCESSASQGSAPFLFFLHPASCKSRTAGNSSELKTEGCCKKGRRLREYEAFHWVQVPGMSRWKHNKRAWELKDQKPRASEHPESLSVDPSGRPLRRRQWCQCPHACLPFPAGGRAGPRSPSTFPGHACAMQHAQRDNCL